MVAVKTEPESIALIEENPNFGIEQNWYDMPQ